MNSKAKFCGECGVHLPEGADFCGECGARVDHSTSRASKTDNAPEFAAAPSKMTAEAVIKSIPLSVLWIGLLLVIALPLIAGWAGLVILLLLAVLYISLLLGKVHVAGGGGKH